MSTAEQSREQAEKKPEDKPSQRAVFKGPFDTFNKALIAAQLNAKAVEKNSENTWHKYKYASAEALIEEARAALNTAGLATIMERWEILPPRQGSEYQIIKIYFKTLHDSSDDTLAGDVEYHIFPEKGRPDDKATATALTYAEGYYLRGLLCLPRVDAETDVDQRNDKGFDPDRRRSQERPQQRNGNQQRGGNQQRTNGNGQNRQQSRPQQQQRPSQGQQRNGNAPPPNAGNQQRPANGTPPAQNPQTQAPPSGAQQPTADAQPNGASQRSERYQTWRARLVAPGLPASQLRAMAAAIRKDDGLSDEEKNALAEGAERHAVKAEQAAESAGAEAQ